MKKHITLSLMAIGLLSSANLQAAEDLSTMFSEGKVSGQVRAFSISRAMDYSDSTKDDFTRNANAIGGHLKYETADFKGLSFGTAFYTTNGFLNDDKRTDYTKVDPTLLGKDNEGYSILGEAYVAYDAKDLGTQTNVKFGRQKLNTPMAGADDARMLPNLFEAVVVSNTDISDTTLVAAHVTGFAQGTFGRAYNGGILSATSGYSAVDSRNQVGDFKNMGDYAVGEHTDGVSILSATYTGVKGLKLQLWDYYAHDILNMIYAEAGFSWNCLLTDSVKPFVAAQFIKQNEVGDKHLGDLSGMYWAAKAGASVENFTAYVAYSQTSENDASDLVGAGNIGQANAIISPWGGMPAYTQGMVTRHQFLAGTKAYKIAASYNFKAFGPDLKAVLYYANFDMDKNNGYTQKDASESGFDLIYNTGFVKNLQLRLRGNYARDFNVNTTGDTVSWNEHRFIVNYTF